MTGRRRRPGDPYEVGYARPPQHTRFKKGLSGNPSGRPPKKPDFYTELTRVLHDTVTITFEGEPQEVTVQQALLLRLRGEALRGEVWAGKLLQKVVEATPDGGSLYDDIEREVQLFKAPKALELMVEESKREKANQNRTEKSPNGDGRGNSCVTALRRLSPPPEPGAEARESRGYQGSIGEDGKCRD